KVLAALRAGITTVLLPAANKKELLEIPEEARNQLTFVWLATVDEALNAALSAPEAAVGVAPQGDIDTGRPIHSHVP
ncbi:MAG: S16 family serine protease, partial [Burkholderiales bacterium]